MGKNNIYGIAVLSLLFNSTASGDAWDPADNVSGSATFLMIDPTDRIHGEHSLSVEVDVEDWFRFNLTSNITYVFEADSSGNDTVGYIFHEGDLNNPVDEGDDENGSDFVITYTPEESGIFYLLAVDYHEDDLTYWLKYKIQDASDNDGDQLPDAWELHTFGTTNVTDTGNEDGDLMNNLQEYVAGTDANDPESYLMISNFNVVAGTVEWDSVSARQYTIYQADNLTNQFLGQLPVVEYPDNSFSVSDLTGITNRFYQLKVELAP